MRYFTQQQINQFFPVVGIVSFRGGMIVMRACTISLNQARYVHERGKILMVSKRSLDRLALLVRSTDVNFNSLMTLTYGANFPLSGRRAKKDLNHFLISAKRSFGRFEYVWVLEFQERGAVHFHIACTLPEPTQTDREIFSFHWARISTPHNWDYCAVEFVEGRPKFKGLLATQHAVYERHLLLEHWEKVRKGDSLSHYFAKYSMKIRQKKVPKHYSDVGRFWGASSGVRMPDGDYFHGNERTVREVCAVYGRDVARWEVLPKVILLG